MSNFLKFSLALTIIVLVATAGLSKVYLMTRDKIKEQERKKISNALQVVLEDAFTFKVEKAS